MSLTLVNPSKSFELSLVADETADDSDKVLTVPARSIYQILWIWVELTTTATAGDRQLEIQVRDGSDDVVLQIQAGVTQAASLTYNYLFGVGLPDLTAVRDSTYMLTPLPPLMLPGGYDIRIWDNNAVAAGADDMVVQMMVAQQKG